jgi:hypothetical protein
MIVSLLDGPGCGHRHRPAEPGGLADGAHHGLHLTNRRVVMRIGIVLTLTFNLPCKRIVGAGLRLDANGSGDLALTLRGEDRIAYLHLWPHARPWKLARPEPMLRSVPQAAVSPASGGRLVAQHRPVGRRTELRRRHGHPVTGRGSPGQRGGPPGAGRPLTTAATRPHRQSTR